MAVVPVLLTLLATGVASADEPSADEPAVRAWLGLAGGPSFDLGDRLGPDTDWRVGGHLEVPVRLVFRDVPWVRVRLDVRGEGAAGRDQLTWEAEVDDRVVRYEDDDSHRAWQVRLGAALGVDAVIPTGEAPVKPSLGATIGVDAVGVYHALEGETLVLIDPESDARIDPFTLQPALSVGLHLDVAFEVAPWLDLVVSTGYAPSFVAAADLRLAPVERAVLREAYLWNPMRASAGLWFRL